MQNQIKPQVEASVQAAFELANLSFAQAERITELTLEQAKVNAELAQDQLTSALEVKDPTEAIALLKAQLETSAKSLAGFAATAFELGQQFQAEATAFAEGHFDQAHAAANKAINDNLQQAPEGSDAAVTAVKAAIAASNKALAEAEAIRAMMSGPAKKAPVKEEPKADPKAAKGTLHKPAQAAGAAAKRAPASTDPKDAAPGGNKKLNQPSCLLAGPMNKPKRKPSKHAVMRVVVLAATTGVVDLKTGVAMTVIVKNTPKRLPLRRASLKSMYLKPSPWPSWHTRWLSKRLRSSNN